MSGTAEQNVYFDGQAYLSAGDAATKYGFTRDYIARLCREGRVDGRKIAGNWHINIAGLTKFMLAQQHAHAVRHAALRDDRLREYNRAKAVHNPFVKPFSSSVQQKVGALADRVSSGAAMHGELLTSTTRDMAARAGLSEAAVRLTMQGAAHVPSYATTPVGEFLHRFFALTMATLMVFGAASVVNKQFPHVVSAWLSESVSTAARTYRAMSADGVTDSAIGRLRAIMTNPRTLQAAAVGLLPVLENGRIEAKVVPYTPKIQDTNVLNAKEARIERLCLLGPDNRELCLTTDSLREVLDAIPAEI